MSDFAYRNQIKRLLQSTNKYLFVTIYLSKTQLAFVSNGRFTSKTYVMDVPESYAYQLSRYVCDGEFVVYGGIPHEIVYWLLKTSNQWYHITKKY